MSTAVVALLTLTVNLDTVSPVTADFNDVSLRDQRCDSSVDQQKSALLWSLRLSSLDLAVDYT